MCRTYVSHEYMHYISLLGCFAGVIFVPLLRLKKPEKVAQDAAPTSGAIVPLRLQSQATEVARHGPNN